MSLVNQEQIEKYLRLRAKKIPTGSMVNLKHFKQAEVNELRKMFPEPNITDWHKFSVKS